MSEAPKRFYATASWLPAEDGYTVVLDERPLRTPRGGRFYLPTPGLAHACAQEWLAQGERIAPRTMPLTRLCFAALERSGDARRDLISHIVSHAETDLVSHRADAPGMLVARESAAWDPLIDWMREAMGVALPVSIGVVAQPLDAAARARILAAAEALDDFRLTALAQAVGLSGSAAIGFALLAGRLDAEAAYATAQLDDLYSLETWGEDDEARARLDQIRQEFAELAHFLALLA